MHLKSDADITKFLGAGENTIVMMVDSTENPDIPPFGHTIDYLCFGGIYRDVNLYLAQELWIENVLVRYDLNGNEAVLYPEIQADSYRRIARPGRRPCQTLYADGIFRRRTQQRRDGKGERRHHHTLGYGRTVLVHGFDHSEKRCLNAGY